MAAMPLVSENRFCEVVCIYKMTNVKQFNTYANCVHGLPVSFPDMCSQNNLGGTFMTQIEVLFFMRSFNLWRSLGAAVFKTQIQSLRFP